MPRDLLHFLPFLRAEIRSRAGQEIENRQLFLGELLAHMTSLLLGERLAEGEELFEQVLDVPAAGVISLDQVLELREVIGTRAVDSNQLAELRADRGLESSTDCWKS
jgi:hypothetical protein